MHPYPLDSESHPDSDSWIVWSLSYGPPSGLFVANHCMAYKPFSALPFFYEEEVSRSDLSVRFCVIYADRLFFTNCDESYELST